MCKKMNEYHPHKYEATFEKEFMALIPYVSPCTQRMRYCLPEYAETSMF